MWLQKSKIGRIDPMALEKMVNSANREEWKRIVSQLRIADAT